MAVTSCTSKDKPSPQIVFRSHKAVSQPAPRERKSTVAERTNPGTQAAPKQRAILKRKDVFIGCFSCRIMRRKTPTPPLPSPCNPPSSTNWVLSLKLLITRPILTALIPGAARPSPLPAHLPTTHQLPRIHRLFEPLAQLGPRGHHGPQHVPGCQVADAVGLGQLRSLRERTDMR